MKKMWRYAKCTFNKQAKTIFDDRKLSSFILKGFACPYTRDGYQKRPGFSKNVLLYTGDNTWIT